MDSAHANLHVFLKKPITVPAILNGPEDVVLEYSDNLTATFSCTAFGGNESEINIAWATEIPDELQPPQEAVNPDGSITSIVTTNILNLSNRGSEYTCSVSYSGDSEVNEDFATLSLGMSFTMYL